MVQTERLELSHRKAPDPKSGVSTNFTTSARLVLSKYYIFFYLNQVKLTALLKLLYSLQIFINMSVSLNLFRDVSRKGENCG